MKLIECAVNCLRACVSSLFVVAVLAGGWMPLGTPSTSVADRVSQSTIRIAGGDGQETHGKGGHHVVGC